MSRILFHGTSTVFKQRIMRRGLLPRERTGKSTYEGELISDPKRIYLTDVYAFQFALRAIEKHGGNPLILKACVEDAALEPDTDFAEGGLHSMRFTDALKCLELTGCVSTRKPVSVMSMWVVSKKLWTEISEQGSCRIETGFRHRGFHKIHMDQLGYLLMYSKRFLNRDGYWEEC